MITPSACTICVHAPSEWCSAPEVPHNAAEPKIKPLWHSLR